MSQTTAQLIGDLVQPLGHADGTEGAPTLSFKDDEDTGLFRPGDNTLGLATGGSTRLTIDSSGRLLVGTTSARSSTGAIQVETAGTTDRSRFEAFTNIDSAAGTHITLGKSRGTTAGSNTIVQISDEIGALNFHGTDGANNIRSAQIKCIVDGTPGTNDMPGRLVFSTTADGASSVTEQMRINSNGRVGIGALSVDEHLHIEGTGTQRVKIEATDTGIAGLVLLNTNRRYDVQVNGSDLQIYDNTATSERMRIDSAGRVLVGTSADGTGRRLQVEGTDFAGSCFSTRRESNNNGGSAIELYKSRGSSFEIVSDDDQLGYIRFYGSQGSADAEAARIRVDVDGTPSSTSMPGRLLFFTTPSGTTSPAERLQINASGAMGLGVTPEPQGTGFTNFQFGGLGNLGASSSQSAGGAIYLYNNTYRATAGQWSYLVTDEATRYQALNGRHQFDVAPSGTADAEVSFAEKIRIDTDGLKFNGDTAAANALDDYEEGSWTPLPAGLSNTPSWSNQKGRYTKIGRLVHIKGFLQNSTNNQFTTTSDVFAIGTLPFTPDNNNAGYQNVHGSMSSQSFTWLGSGNNSSNLTAGQVVPALEQINGTWGVVFVVFDNDSVRSRVQNNAEHNAGFILEFELTYTTAA